MASESRTSIDDLCRPIDVPELYAIDLLNAQTYETFPFAAVCRAFVGHHHTWRLRDLEEHDTLVVDLHDIDLYEACPVGSEIRNVQFDGRYLVFR